MTGDSSNSRARVAIQAVAASVGLACLLRMVFFSYRMIRVESFPRELNLTVHALYLVALLVSLCVLVALREKSDSMFLRSRAPVVVAGIVSSALCWLVVLLESALFEVAVLAGVALIAFYAFALAACLCAWGCTLFKMDIARALVAIAAVPAALAVFSFVPHLSGVRSVFVTGAMSVLMVPCLFFAYGKSGSPCPRTELSALKGLPLSVIVVFLCGIYATSIAIGVLSLDDFDRMNLGASAVVLAVSLVTSASLAACIVANISHARLATVVQMVCILLVIAVLFVTMGYSLLGSTSRLPSSLLNVSRRFCVAGSLIVISQCMQKRMMSPTLLFGMFGIFGMVIPQIVQGPVAPAVNYVANGMLLQYHEIVILAVSGVLILSTFVLLVPLREPQAELRDQAGQQEQSLQGVYDTIAQGYGLTAREQEVMQLIAEGNSMRKVGEVLFISLGTVQTHSKKIYRKLDIHSRQELLDLIDRHSP